MSGTIAIFRGKVLKKKTFSPEILKKLLGILFSAVKNVSKIDPWNTSKKFFLHV
jgi:hypothetical protein